MRVKTLLRLFFVAAIAVPVHAEVDLHISGGLLTGASGVVVNGGTYDLSLRVGSCLELFSGCDDASDFTFSGMGAAAAASQALLDQVLVDGAPEGDFNSMLDHVPGCVSPAAICRIMTPYGRNVVAPTTVDTYTAVQLYQFSFFDTIAQQALVPPEQINLYAIWSVSGPPPVPEPATGLLAAVATAFLGGVRMRRRRRVAESKPKPAV